MKYAFTTEEYVDIIFVYEFCYGNAKQAANEYRCRPQILKFRDTLYIPKFRYLNIILTK